MKTAWTEQLFSLGFCPRICRRRLLAGELGVNRCNYPLALVGQLDCLTLDIAREALNELVEVGIAKEADGTYRLK